MTRSPSRRSFVLATTACVGALAGCVDADSDGSGGGDGSDGEGGESTTGDADGGSTTDAGDDDGSTTDAGEDGDGDSTTSEGDADSTTGEGEEEASTTDDGEETTSGEGTRTKAKLDLREANVTGVELEDEGGGEFLFSVTLYHDDDSEEGYANWWAVETLDGEELGRRELLHEHGTGEFTREKTIAIPDDVECVVVRGHDQMHDYGGQAAIVSVPSGESRFVDQGPKRKSFGDTYCP